MSKINRKDLLTSIAPLLGLMLVALLFGLLSDWTIFSARNLKMLVNQNFMTLIICMGATFYWAWGILDLSVSGVVGCAAVVSALCINAGVPVLGIFASIAAAVALDLCIAFVGVIFKLPMFLSTLCFMFITNGIVQVATLKQVIVITSDVSRFTGIELKLIIMAIVVLAIMLIFNYTSLGRQSKMIGGNERAAILSGVRANRVKIISFVIAGVCIGIAGFFSAIRVQTIDYTIGSGVQFNIMTAMVFGGMPFGGGKYARAFNGLIGTVTYALLSNGLQLLGVPFNLIYLIKGAIFLIVVFLSFPKSNSKLLP